MKTFEIEMPDGKVYEVTAPDSATHEDAIKHVKQGYYNIKTAIPNRDAGIVDKIANSSLGGFVRGLRDIPDAGAQLLTRGLEAVAPKGSKLESFARAERGKVEAINKAAEQDYAQNWRQGQDTGIDLGRIGGNIAASLPFAAMVPGAAAATLPGRMASGAGVGAITGAMQPVKDGQDFWQEKAAQTGIGAIAGGLAVPVAEKVSKMIANAANKINARFTPVQSAQIQQGLAQEGVDFSKLAQQTQESILKEADEALKAGGQLDFKALARKADFEKVGIKPTLGQLTGDPMQYQFEQNSRGIVGGGESLSQRFNEQNTGLVDAINRMRGGIGDTGLDKYGANVKVQEALRNINNQREAVKNALYKKVQDSAGRQIELSPYEFTQRLADDIDYAWVNKFLPQQFKDTINDIATGKLPFTLNQAIQLRQWANDAYTPNGGATNKALSLLKKHIDDAMQRGVASIDDAANQTLKGAAQDFKIATHAARQQFRMLEKLPALKAAVENGMPDDKFIEKFVISGSVKPRELLNLRSQLRESPEVWQEIRGQVVEFLKNKAVGGQLDEFAKFSQAGFKNGLNTIGDARMKILFSPAEIAELKAIQRVAASIQVQPVGSAVNNSGTSQAIANLLDRLSNVPYLRELAINPLRNFQLQGQVNNALNPGARAMSQPTAIPPEIIRRYNFPAAVSAYPLLQGVTQ